MKKVLLLLSSLTLVVGLTACETADDAFAGSIRVYTRDTSSGTRAGFMEGIGFDEDIVALAEDVRKMVGDSVRSFINEDLKGAYDVIEYDDTIDQAYYRLKDKIVLALKVQTDTMQVNSLVSQLTIAKYMEKLADHAQNISEWIIFTVSGEYKA